MLESRLRFGFDEPIQTYFSGHGYFKTIAEIDMNDHSGHSIQE